MISYYMDNYGIIYLTLKICSSCVVVHDDYPRYDVVIGSNSCNEISFQVYAFSLEAYRWISTNLEGNLANPLNLCRPTSKRKLVDIVFTAWSVWRIVLANGSLTQSCGAATWYNMPVLKSQIEKRV